MELNWPVVLLTSTVMWAVMMYRTTLKARERAECAEGEARIANVKLSIECGVNERLRATVVLWRERYHELWADTHLGDDAIRSDDDDGRS